MMSTFFPFYCVYQVISQYGILENVFTKQELLSENIKEKEDKIAFLQKFISHICKIDV
jgi:hypothetical protein